MNILVFGRNGQVAWELRRSLATLGDVTALEPGASNGLHADFAKPDGLAATVAALKPDVIVNAAAYTAVDKAEAEPELARAVNALAPGVLAQAAKESGALLVHYSTDYVFDGSGTRGWREDDAPTPLNVYGRTKLEGERLVAAAPRHLIFRTSWVYGAHGANFAKTMLRLARERDRLGIVDDQVGTPTGAELLADVTAHAILREAAEPGLGGLYHLTASGETSWHGYARFVLEKAAALGQQFKVQADGVAAIPSSAYPTPAQRPHNSRLDTARVRAAFGLTLPHWQEGVSRMLEELFPGASA